MLLEVKDYIKQRKWVNLQDLSQHFQRDPETMREMVAHWLRKGVVRRVPKPSGCGVKCGACKPSSAEVYCWCDVQLLQPLTSCH
ncbi:MAG: FeoC-like transcriptional regulator [Coxiellaceae bacterium]|nr:FeoC-like transcriptional regulator [Coxiellaceae bacterium]